MNPAIPLRWCKAACSIHPSTISLPLKVTDVNGEETVHESSLATILWPWDALNYLWKSDHFFQFVSDDPKQALQVTVEHWRRSSHLDFFRRLELEDWQVRPCIPLNFHADGVKIYKNQKCWIYSLSSACRRGPSTQTKLVILPLREATIVKHKTHDAVGKIVGYICQTLQSGLYPSVDEAGHAFAPGTEEYRKAGTPFAGGWRAAFNSFKGDWEARVVVHKLQRFYNAKWVCEHCMAGRHPDWTFGDFRPSARCLSVRFTHEQYHMMCSPDRFSSWRHVKGWTIHRNVEVSWSY